MPGRLMMAAVLLGLIAVPMMARAGTSFTLPIGLAAGARYELVFATSMLTPATSEAESFYNNVVTRDAALNPLLPVTTWSAVASTATVSAFSNVCGVACADVPVYLVTGREVVLSVVNLFNSANVALLAAINVTESGNASTGSVWTGSTNAGGIASGNALGSSFPESSFGNETRSVFDNCYGCSAPTDSLALYAVSGVLTVSGAVAVPEPASTAVFLTAVAGIIRLGRGNRRKPRFDR